MRSEILNPNHVCEGTLLLSLDRDVRPKEEFFRDVGLRNVGRVITLAPQILTFDVATQLLPKMRFLDKVWMTFWLDECVVFGHAAAKNLRFAF